MRPVTHVPSRTVQPTPTATGQREFGVEISSRLACPLCKSRLDRVDSALRCSSTECRRSYPIQGGVPVLIHDENSLFSVADFKDSGPSRFYDDELDRGGERVGLLKRLKRSVGRTLVYFPLKLDYMKGREALEDMIRSGAKRILVVGSGASAYQVPDDVEVVYTDVAFGAQTRYLCDCHDLPFADETFDGAIVVAVFEHVADPYRCAEEIRRVLVPEGRIYSATPFLQPVHMGRYDFTRFTFLGHRRLLRGFDALKDGMALGPGSTAAWAIEYFLLSFSDSVDVRRYLRTIGMVVTVPFKFADRLLQHKEGALDAAGGLFFYGKKRAEPISDRELMRLYRGRDQVYDDVDSEVRKHF